MPIRQTDAERPVAPEPGRADPIPDVVGDAPTVVPPEIATPRENTPPQAAKPKRFHGTVFLDATRVGRDAGRIAEEVIAHLDGLVHAKVTVTIEIEAEMPDGAPDQVVRTVTENCRTLKFTSQGSSRSGSCACEDGGNAAMQHTCSKSVLSARWPSIALGHFGSLRLHRVAEVRDLNRVQSEMLTFE